MRLLHKGRKDSSGWRLPAKPLEDLVVNELELLLRDQQQLHTVFNIANMTIPALEKITAKAKLLNVDLANDDHTKAYAIIHQVIDRMTIAPGLLTITLNRKNFAALLDVQVNNNDPEEKTYALSLPFSLKRRGNEAKLIIGNHAEAPVVVDETLVKTISDAHRWMRQRQSGAAATIVEIAKAEALDDGEVMPLGLQLGSVWGLSWQHLATIINPGSFVRNSTLSRKFINWPCY